MQLDFVLADVFTERAFGGNQLAVFPDARGISDGLMQRLAREFNFSETTFVLPPAMPGHTHRVRIFTPTAEIPFAGHPTVGTASVLAATGAVETEDGRVRLVFEEGMATVTVDVETGAGRNFARLSIARAPELRPCDIPRTALARMLGLEADAIGLRQPWLAGVGGTPYCCIPLASPALVAAARFDPGAWERTLPPGSWTREVYAVAGDFAPGGTLKARMWAPGVGVPEDPATGSAAATLVGSLAALLPDAAGRFAWTIEQGAEIGRPSVIEADAVKQGGAVVEVRVGGSTVIMARGRMAAPAR
jgi:trans-2,3-dihydro-3-hydroxyanthranilate isomerase